LAERAGFETPDRVELARTHVDSRQDTPSRVDASARLPDVAGPTELSAADASSPRVALVRALAGAAAAAFEAGDKTATRVALDALRALLEAPAARAAVVDLASARVRKEREG
jgi:hypothetical protein